MSLFVKRNEGVFHRRPFTVPDGSTTFVDIGPTFIAIPDRTSVAQGEDLLTTPTEEFLAIIDPKDDVVDGDIMVIDNVSYEVRKVRRFPGRKRIDYGEIDLERKEVPGLIPELNDARTSFLEQLFIPRNGQTLFFLLMPGVLFGLTAVFVNGILYPANTSYTVSGNKLVWNDVPFVLDKKDRLLIKYQVA